MTFTYIFFLMILFHIVDDFVLQPICLSKLKQKSFWQKECGDNFIKYKNDYLMALLIHALSWSIMITLPWIICKIPVDELIYTLVIFGNTFIHGITDHIKANKLKIDLIMDQTIHFIQILVTFIIFICNVI